MAKDLSGAEISKCVCSWDCICTTTPNFKTKKIAEWPRLVEIAAKGNEPHRVAFYLFELASEFHGLWNKGNDDTSLRFVQEGNAATSAAKIALARAVGVVISAGLGILGVTPVEEMR